MTLWARGIPNAVIASVSRSNLAPAFAAVWNNPDDDVYDAL
jgi:hypothetical protein